MITFKKKPEGKALLRIQHLLSMNEATTHSLIEGLSDEGIATYGRDVLSDLIEHLCADDDDCVALAASIALIYLDLTQVHDGRP